MNSHKSNRPLVSILVPCYNHEQYVIECLESIKAQDYENIELLIIDDGSKDSSFALIDAWCTSNPLSFARLVWKRTENRGITRTLDDLLGAAQGEFVAFCASDDGLTPGSVSARARVLVDDRSVGAVFGRAELMDPDSIVIADDAAAALYRAKSVRYRPSCIRDELFYRWSMVGPVTLYRRAALNAAGGIDTNYMVEDRSLYMRLMLSSEISYINDSVARYRFHKKSVTRAPVTRTSILLDIARLHVDMAQRYHGGKRLYLQSYKVDISMLSRNENPMWKAAYLAWKANRKIWASLVMVGISVTRSS